MRFLFPVLIIIVCLLVALTDEGKDIALRLFVGDSLTKK